jgi:uncharacterized membrane protein YhaH (DUF805 family)
VKALQFVNGRINRATYWMCLGASVLVYAALNVMNSGSVKVSEVLLILMCVPRLHDLGRSGWWALMIFLIELSSVFLAPKGDVFIALGVAMLVIMALLVVLGILPGQPRANRWGEPPEPGVQWKFKKRDNVAKVFD